MKMKVVFVFDNTWRNMTVYELKTGDSAKISDILAGADFKRRLTSLGITKSSHFTLKHVTMMKNVFELELEGGALVALRKGEAQKIKVELCKK